MSRFAILALLVAFAAAGFHLTADNFDAAIEGKNAFVKFYAPWCGHCKRMQPDWDKLSAEFPEGNDQVVVAEVDCTAHQAVCSKNGVRGYPTIMWKKADGEFQKYAKGRDAASLSAHAKEIAA